MITYKAISLKKIVSYFIRNHTTTDIDVGDMAGEVGV